MSLWHAALKSNAGDGKSFKSKMRCPALTHEGVFTCFLIVFVSVSVFELRFCFRGRPQALFNGDNSVAQTTQSLIDPFQWEIRDCTGSIKLYTVSGYKILDFLPTLTLTDAAGVKIASVDTVSSSYSTFLCLSVHIFLSFSRSFFHYFFNGLSLFFSFFFIYFFSFRFLFVVFLLFRFFIFSLSPFFHSLSLQFFFSD